MQTTNTDAVPSLTDEKILDEFEQRAMMLRDAAGTPKLDGVRVIEGVRALLSASKPAAPIGKLWATGKPGNYAFAPAADAPVIPYVGMDVYAASPAAPAQSGEPVAWFIADDNGEVYRATGYEHERDQWRAVGHEVHPLYAAPQPSQPVEAGETCKCRRLGDWRGFHHPLCDQASEQSAVVLDDERAAKTKCTQCCGLGYYRGKWPFDWSVTCEICQGKGQVRAASPQPAVCATCKGRGMIGGPSYYAPDEGGEPCPDCTIAQLVTQTERALTDAQRKSVWWAVLTAEADEPEPGSLMHRRAQDLRALLTAAQSASGGDRE
ncbi:hypothetical protein [Paraburkholderia sp. RL18-085-BIA-A]|uniref:hypothetical protein n=1 Tax=Paraburkholderia sp. RL18-085-BIA-A TaxID=3031633 RepID=UPI0038BAE1C5